MVDSSKFERRSAKAGAAAGMHMTPARMAQAALQVACVLRSPNMQHWATVLACDMLAAPWRVGWHSTVTA